MPRNQFQSFSLSVEASGGELLRLEDVNAVSSRLVTFVFKQAPRPTSAPSSSIGPGRSSSSHASASHDPLMSTVDMRFGAELAYQASYQESAVDKSVASTDAAVELGSLTTSQTQCGSVGEERLDDLPPRYWGPSQVFGALRFLVQGVLRVCRRTRRACACLARGVV